MVFSTGLIEMPFSLHHELVTGVAASWEDGKFEAFIVFRACMLGACQSGYNMRNQFCMESGDYLNLPSSSSVHNPMVDLLVFML